MCHVINESTLFNIQKIISADVKATFIRICEQKMRNVFVFKIHTFIAQDQQGTNVIKLFKDKIYECQ
jgi:hypothetical protein